MVLFVCVIIISAYVHDHLLIISQIQPVRLSGFTVRIQLSLDAAAYTVHKSATLHFAVSQYRLWSLESSLIPLENIISLQILSIQEIQCLSTHCIWVCFRSSVDFVDRP